MSHEVEYVTLFLEMSDSDGNKNRITLFKAMIAGIRTGYRLLAIIIRFEKRGMGICNGKIISSGTSQSPT